MAKRCVNEWSVGGHLGTLGIVSPKGGRFVAMFDRADRDLLADRQWYIDRPGSYLYARSASPREFMHHVLLPKRKGFVTDHRDGNGLNNCRSNLRYATYQQNRANSKPKKDNPFKGIYWMRRDDLWVATIVYDGKCHHLGRFPTPVLAALAYDEAAKRVFGDFANTNF